MTATLKLEVNIVKRKLHSRPTQAIVYPTAVEDSIKISFSRNKNDNLMERIMNFKVEREHIGNSLTDLEKIDFVAR